MNSVIRLASENNAVITKIKLIGKGFVILLSPIPVSSVSVEPVVLVLVLIEEL